MCGLWKKLPVVMVFMTLAVFFSCKTQNLSYIPVSSFNDSLKFFRASHAEHVIQPDDKINLSIHGHEDLSVGSVYGIYNANEVYGRWLMVDPEGMVALPRLGTTQLAGLTISEAEDSLNVWYGKWIVNPIVRLRVLNRQISVLGEIKSPGILNLEKENNQLSECIARSGDFDFYADKRKVQVVRMINDTLKAFTVDFTDSDDIRYTALSVKPGDIVYVPSRKGKVWDKRSGSILTVTGVITTIAIITQIFK
jgi:polysaccharide export outer membrane protein